MKIRTVDRIYQAPAAHWVGDGFHVHTMFSHMAGNTFSDPYLMLDYAAPMSFPPQPNATHAQGVGQHPHKGFETVTIAYQGEVAHRDSSGGGGVIGTGDVQWMTAGSGVVHEEFHSPAFTRTGGTFEMVQLWVNLPAKDKNTPPRYQHLAAENIPHVDLQNKHGEHSGDARIIAGKYGQSISGAAQTFSELNLWDIRIDADGETILRVPQNHNVMLLVRHGNIRLNGENDTVSSARLVTFTPPTSSSDDDSVITVHAVGREAQLLLMSGVPIGEPVVGYGPFVMNTEAEIHEAISDYKQGRFGQLY